MSVELIGIGLAVVAAIAALFVVLRQGRELQHLRILAEQARDGTRTEAKRPAPICAPNRAKASSG